MPTGIGLLYPTFEYPPQSKVESHLLLDMYRMLKNFKLISWDVEATGLNVWGGARPFSIAFCDPDGETEYYEWPVDPLTRMPSPDAESLARVRFLLSNPDIPKVGHNVKFDTLCMDKGMGIPVLGEVNDTLHMAHILGEKEDDNRATLGLKYLANKYLDIPTTDESLLQKSVVVARRIGKKLGWNLGDNVKADYWLPAAVWRLQPDLAKRAGLTRGVNEEYCTGDVRRTMLLFQLFDRWMDEQNLRPVLEFERKLWPVTYAIETRGVKVDREMAERLAVSARARRKEINASLGGINLDSPKQLRELFFEKLKLPILAWTKGGKSSPPQPQLDKKVLEQYVAEGVKEAAMLREDRHCGKLMGTYLNNYIRKSVSETSIRRGIKNVEWIIHFSLVQLGPITGRFSALDPNMQNVPKKRGKGTNVLYAARVPFGPRKGYRWYSYDYQQIEARIFAELANEKTMLAAFAAGRDVYVELASILFSKSADSVTEDERAISKAIFLGKLYGLGVEKMAIGLGMRLDRAQIIVRAFNKTFPGIRDFMQSTIREVKNEAYVYTVLGRRIPIIEKAFRGVNYKVQGSAADLLKLAMINIHAYLKDHAEIDCHMVMPIHDELIFEIAEKDCTKTLLNTLGNLMSDNHGWFTKVTTPVDCSRILKSWGSKVEVPLCLTHRN